MARGVSEYTLTLRANEGLPQCNIEFTCKRQAFGQKGETFEAFEVSDEEKRNRD